MLNATLCSNPAHPQSCLNCLSIEAEIDLLNEIVDKLLFVPTPLEGGGTIYSTGFFLFRQFWPIDIFIVES